jgi:putative addiction module antidote
MIKLEIQTVGDSAGVVLPEEVLSRLKLQVGDTVLLTETRDGYQLRPYSPEFERQMQIAERIMSEHRQTLKKLAE